MVDGEFWREDQNHSRLFFAPTGRPLHQGQAYAGVFLQLDGNPEQKAIVDHSCAAPDVSHVSYRAAHGRPTVRVKG